MRTMSNNMNAAEENLSLSFANEKTNKKNKKKKANINFENSKKEKLHFDEIYQECVDICQENDISIPCDKSEIQLKRSRSLPKKYQQFIVTENLSFLESEEANSKKKIQKLASTLTCT